jgi:predicted TIM-barrel fold metal-dependent hydrolase
MESKPAQSLANASPARSLRTYLLLGCAAVLLGGCATGSSSRDRQAPAVRVDASVTEPSPGVDHHTHLMGPAIASLVDGAKPLPAIDVPAPIARLLQRRADAWNDINQLRSLFSVDSLALSQRRYGWVSGRDAVADSLATTFGRPYTLTPVALQDHGSFAQIAGYYTRGQEPSPEYIGYFSITMKRNADGEWVISQEIPRFPFPRKQGLAAEDLVKQLDRNGIGKAIVLSEAFWADGPFLKAPNAYQLVKAENDWTARQAAAFADRLIAFCSFNPVAAHALTELERCAASKQFRGIKLSFAMSGVDLKQPDHVAKVRSVFSVANAHRLPIVIHVRSGPDFTSDHVEILLREVMSAAPDIPVQIAHLWGGEAYSASALRAWAAAVSSRRPEARNLYFDVAEVWAEIAQTDSIESQEEIAAAIRQIGLSRILFGSDGRTEQRRAWRLFKATVPLREDEFAAIAANVAPYAR